MKSSRNLIIIFLAFVLIFGTPILPGCSDDGGEGGSTDISVTGIILAPTNTSILVGETEQLTATIEPADATNQNVTWESIDDSVASVSSSGLVTAVAGGATTITVTTEDGNYTAACTVATNWTVGNKVTFTADSVSFVMAYVPGKTFPIGSDDDGDYGSTDVPSPATVPNAYWIGETEVTYELWNTVYTWATANEYFFQNEGNMGGGTDDTNQQHPVTEINWRDAMVFCNALTEWYNAKTGTDYICVYTYSNAIIRDSRTSTNATACDEVVADIPATGFRLLTSNEWELAARWRNNAINTVSGYSNPWFTRGNSASGASADYTDLDATQAVAWYSDSSSHEVKGLTANALSLYDMSGNVGEWCYDWDPDLNGCRVFRGGDWFHPASFVRIGSLCSASPNFEEFTLGFRLARTE